MIHLKAGETFRTPTPIFSIVETCADITKAIPSPSEFPGCKIFVGENGCFKYQLDPNGLDVISCSEADSCIDIIMPARC